MVLQIVAPGPPFLSTNIMNVDEGHTVFAGPQKPFAVPAVGFFSTLLMTLIFIVDAAAYAWYSMERSDAFGTS